MVLAGAIRFRLHWKTKRKPRLHVHGGFSFGVFPFSLFNAPATFQRSVLGIFSDFIHKCVEIYMDDFSVYGDSFKEALDNLEKVLIRCKEVNVALSNKKCKMLSKHGIVLGHHISFTGIQVDLTKIKVIVDFPSAHSPKEVRNFLG